MDYKNIIVHSTTSELRLILGNAYHYYIDKDNADIYWVKDESYSEYIPHTTTSSYVEKSIITGGIGSGTQGVQGLQGLQGIAGTSGSVQGLQGPMGLQGPIGTGNMGPQGFQGEVGPQGPQGEKGDKGDPGTTITKVSELENDAKYQTEDQLNSSVNIIIAKLTASELQISSLYSQLESLKMTNKVDVDITSTESLNQPEADLIINGTVAEEGKVSIIGKSVKLDNVISANSQLVMKAESGDVVITGLSTSGNYPQSSGNAANIINTNEYVRITNSNIAQTGYNAIEIGYDNTAPKGIDIDGIDFEATFTNNAISIFAHAKDAVINITNCHFKKSSNALRISNKLNVPATINLINCKIDEWDSNLEYQGVILFQDYTSTSNEEAQSAKRFANLKVNFKNVIGPDGNVIKPKDVSTVLGTKDKNQIAYVYYDKGGFITYSEDVYPKFTFE